MSIRQSVDDASSKLPTPIQSTPDKLSPYKVIRDVTPRAYTKPFIPKGSDSRGLFTQNTRLKSHVLVMHTILSQIQSIT